MTRTPSLWENDRMSLERSMALTIESLHACALTTLGELAQRGMRTQVVLPDLDDRFFVYLFDRCVPAPKNRFRWCTSQLKIEPMERALADLRQATGDKLLMLTGVRLGESAASDSRIALSCDRDGTECGQGWFQESPPASVADVLSPLLHWRVCHIWDWLFFHAPDLGFSTQLVAESSGGEEAEEINARTGCIGCNLASKDVALDALLKVPQWAYLAPLKRLKPLYTEMKRPLYRLRKQGERNKDGRLPANPMRLGPYTMEARSAGPAAVLTIQDDTNQIARTQGRPLIDLINDEEQARILELIAADTWPDRWTGREVRGDACVPLVLAEGIMQPLLGGGL